MLKQYTVNVHIDGHYITEDPHCPSYWRGSGCYDIEVPTWCDLEVEVWAHSEEEARKFALDYEYDDPATIIEIEVIQVERVTFVADLDRDEEEAGVIDCITYKWRENEPDEV